MTPRTTALALVLGLTASAPGRALATDSRAEPIAPVAQAAEGEGAEPAIEAARRHFLRGVEFYNNADYKLSLLEFRRSYELSENYRILYNIGQVNHQLGNYTQALAALERYLREGGREVPDDRRAEVAADIAELAKRIAHVRLALNVDGAELHVDDVPLGRVARRHELVVDAGDHQIEARRKGFQPAHARVTLAAGESLDVRLVLAALEAPRPAPAAPSRAAPAGESGSALIWVGWITTGVLAAGATASGVLAMSRAEELSELRTSPRSTASEREAVRDQARFFAVASDVLVAAAVAAGGASLYVTLSASSEERAPGPVARLGFGPLGVRVEGSY